MVLDNRYSGCVFVRRGATGHLLNQHYLGVMFPIPNTAPQSQSERDAEKNAAGEVNEAFLDKVVDVDEKTATRREITAERKLGITRQDSGFEEFVKEKNELVQNGDHGGPGEDGKSRVGLGGANGYTNGFVWAEGNDAKGKTTRELSRLWMYLDGGNPVNGRILQRGS